VQALGDFDRKLFSRVVHAAFGQRRKTLLNGLDSAGLAPDKKRLTQCIEAAGIAPSVRAETLTLEDFVRLSHALGTVPSPDNLLPQ
jgi:16S rRNA (adenine1518-N6/adenine1519-N6)-dimethyltransferase